MAIIKLSRYHSYRKGTWLSRLCDYRARVEAGESLCCRVCTGSGQVLISVQLPPPQVVYNRISTREEEAKPAVARKIAECLEHPGIRLYNPYFFNKWSLFEWLKGSHATSRHVPATRRLRSSRTLSSMLKTHSSLYLKPESGKAGKGIMRIKYHTEGDLPYRLQIQSGKKNVTYKAASMERLWSRIGKERGDSRYIVQQAIELATCKEDLSTCVCSCRKTARADGGYRHRRKTGRLPQHYDPCSARRQRRRAFKHA